MILLLLIGCNSKPPIVKVPAPGSWEELGDWCDSAQFRINVNHGVMQDEGPIFQTAYVKMPDPVIEGDSIKLYLSLPKIGQISR